MLEGETRVDEGRLAFSSRPSKKGGFADNSSSTKDDMQRLLVVIKICFGVANYGVETTRGLSASAEATKPKTKVAVSANFIIWGER
jgi:hypothetical protein